MNVPCEKRFFDMNNVITLVLDARASAQHVPLASRAPPAARGPRVGHARRVARSPPRHFHRPKSPPAPPTSFGAGSRRSRARGASSPVQSSLGRCPRGCRCCAWPARPNRPPAPRPSTRGSRAAGPAATPFTRSRACRLGKVRANPQSRGVGSHVTWDIFGAGRAAHRLGPFGRSRPLQPRTAAGRMRQPSHGHRRRRGPERSNRAARAPFQRSLPTFTKAASLAGAGFDGDGGVGRKAAHRRRRAAF